jgi:SAM-dependent methyltransferase
MKNNMNYCCRICESNQLSLSTSPDAHFNNKIFKYYNCENCNSFNVFPNPTQDDFKKMYGEDDHTYLKGLTGKIKYNFNYPFANHQGYQIKFLNQIKDKLKNKSLLDYGCGSGFYMKYAEQLGANVSGIEFDDKFVNLLKTKTDFKIHTFENAIIEFENKTFDFIHLGHVLEHLTNPASIIMDLKKFTHQNTLFLIDGPLEQNYCLHRFYVDLGSKLKGKKYRNAIPQHLTLTNQQSQLSFFDSAGLKKEKYIITEGYFPLPSKLEKSIGKIISYFIASISIIISKIIPNSGNIFHYRGKINNI